jgi:serine/threonine protein kinase
MVVQDPLIGRNLDGYDIEELLGHGGMGRVYRGLDTKLKRYAAIKVLEGDSRENPKYEPRFYREAQAIAKLKHPNIVAVYRFNEIDGLYYMAMEYIDGADLRWVLKNYASNNSFVDYSTVSTIIEQIGGALDYAHQNQVIHRDIKPSNIMVSRDGAAILTDFGLALDVDEGSVGEIFGSPHYIAPEQAINSAQAVPQTDLYSLGIILYEMLTGRIPFDTGSAVQIAMAHISDPLPDPHSLNPDLHEAFLPVLETILAKEARDRYQTGADLSKALKDAIRQAQQSKQIPKKTSLVKPSERIAQHKIPLPAPLANNLTKPPTRINQATKVLNQVRQGNRRSMFRWMILLMLIIMTTVVLYLYQNPELWTLNAVSSNGANALIEGRVEAVNIADGYATLEIYGLTVQIERGHPLYESVQVGDILYLDGQYRLENGAYRFDTISLAKQNGEAIEVPTPRGEE